MVTHLKITSWRPTKMRKPPVRYDLEYKWSRQPVRVRLDLTKTELLEEIKDIIYEEPNDC